ncbi:MAG: uncharacterized protein A8A55_2607, partial [Amphiamblys sp. WSBS2006]
MFNFGCIWRKNFLQKFFYPDVTVNSGRKKRCSYSLRSSFGERTRGDPKEKMVSVLEKTEGVGRGERKSFGRHKTKGTGKTRRARSKKSFWYGKKRFFCHGDVYVLLGRACGWGVHIPSLRRGT